MSDLADRIEASGWSRELDEEAAIALGWQERKVTSLGLNGRTPGRWLWCPPDPPFKPRRLPRFTGPRMRKWTIELLRKSAAE